MKNVESDEIRGISPYLANLNFSVQIPTIGNYVKSLGPIILILLITFLLLSFVIGWFTTPLENETGRLEGLLAEVLGKILAAGVLVVFGYWLSRKLVGSFRYMRRILRDPTRSLQDTRPPILYLRAFYEDSEHDKRNLNQRTPEERILLSFEKLGPVFAFGYPGEIGPPLLGATRIYFEHNDWQQAVINLCESAQVVVIDAALTDGVQWELTHLSNSNNPQKILISFFSKIT